MNATGRAPLTVMQLVPAMHSGGVERGTLDVAAELVRRGHRALVVSAPGRLVAALEEAGCRHVPWEIGRKSPLTLRFTWRLRRLMRDEGVDILHARSRVPAWVGFLAWRGMPAAVRPRFVTTVHASHSVSAYSAVMTKGEAVIAVSRTIEKYIADNYPRTDLQRVRVIMRGVDPAEFPAGHMPSAAWRTAFLQQFPATADASAILTLPGRLGLRKGHADFIEIIAQLRAGGAHCHGLIVGETSGRAQRTADALRGQIRAAGLQEHITLTGNRSDIADIHAFSDIVYCLSGPPGESFGRTVAEALTIGTPVIGYDLGGVGEILSEMLPEGRVPPGDIRAAVERTRAFLQAPPAPRPNTLFTLQSMLDATIRLYEELGPRRTGSEPYRGDIPP